MRRSLASISLFASVLAGSGPIASGQSATETSNVLFVVADDLGVDMLATYGVGSDTPTTPTLDSLVTDGIRFENFWSYPVCSPARAAMMTGRHGHRTGIGKAIASDNEYALPLSETILPEVLSSSPAPLAHAVIGKWHLSNATVGGDDAPNLAGVGHYEGILDYPDYYNWTKVLNGTRIPSTTYLTTDQVDSAAAWIQQQEEEATPWVCFLNFSAPHDPWHTPPAGLYTTDLTGLDSATQPRPFYKAAIEAMDAELGRLLQELGTVMDRTTVVFLGDNGTPGEVIAPPLDPSHGKLTVYEGGVNVPLIVSGALVERPGTTCDDLISAVDLFPTIAELAGVSLSEALPPGLRIDGKSFRDALRTPDPMRGSRGQALSIYSQYFSPNGFAPTTRREAVREPRYKLIRYSTGREELYDLLVDPVERFNLLLGALSPAEASAYARLVTAMARANR